MTNKLKFIIIFSIVLFAGLFIGGHQAQAASCSSAGPDGDTTTLNSGTRRTYVYDVSGSQTVFLPIWSDENGQDDMIWQAADIYSGSTFYVDIPLASHPGLGTINVHVYILGNGWEWCDTANFTRLAPQPPSCSSATPDEETVYTTAGTRRTYANGVANATSVLFYEWNDPGGQDDLTGNWGTDAGGGTWYVDLALPSPSHVNVHVYVINADYGAVFCDSASFNVTDPPGPTVDVSASPTSISYGNSSTISWSSTNATSGCNVVGHGGSSGSFSTGALYTTTSYHGDCFGWGTASDDVTVTVAPAPPPTCSSATPDNDSIYTSQATRRTYANNVSGTTTVFFAVWTDAGGQDDITWLGGDIYSGSTWYMDTTMSQHPGTGSVSVHVYMLDPINGGWVFCDSANFNVYQAPTVDISATSAFVTYAGSTTINWSSSSTSSCTVSPPGWTGTSGSQNTGSLTSGVNYTVNCNGTFGGSVSDSQVVNVGPDQAPIGWLDGVNCSTIGGWSYDPDHTSTTLAIHMYYTNPGSTSLIWLGSTTTDGMRSDVNSAYGISGTHGFSISTPSYLKDGGNHQIYAYGIDADPPGNHGLLNSSAININCPPASVDMHVNGVSSLSVLYGTQVTVSWQSYNATSCTAGGTHPGFQGGQSLGGGWNSPPLTSNQTFTLSCSGANGTGNNSVTVTIIDQPSCTSVTPDGDWTIATSGTRITSANGVSNATGVLFAAWTSAGGQDDIVWYSGTNQGGGVWRANVNLASHLGVGAINVHVYMQNASYGNTWCDTGDFSRLNSGQINVNSNIPTSWTITCPLTNPSCPSYSSGANQTSGTYSSAPTSTWTIVPANIPGYSASVSPASAQSGP